MNILMAKKLVGVAFSHEVYAPLCICVTHDEHKQFVFRGEVLPMAGPLSAIYYFCDSFDWLTVNAPPLTEWLIEPIKLKREQGLLRGKDLQARPTNLRRSWVKETEFG